MQIHDLLLFCNGLFCVSRVDIYREMETLHEKIIKCVTESVGALKAAVIWILSLSIYIDEVSATKSLWCYCSPLLRYNTLIVRAALHFDSVIVRSVSCKFTVSLQWQTFNSTATLQPCFIVRPVLAVQTHACTRADVCNDSSLFLCS